MEVGGGDIIGVNVRTDAGIFNSGELCLAERGPSGGTVMKSPGKAAGGPVSIVHLEQRGENQSGGDRSALFVATHQTDDLTVVVVGSRLCGKLYIFPSYITLHQHIGPTHWCPGYI